MKVKISIGEPWDFTGPDGDNTIIGEILHIEGKHIIIKTKDVYVINDISSKIFMFVTRHKESDFYIDKSVHGNGYIVPNYNEDEDINALLNKSSFVCIGNVQISL